MPSVNSMCDVWTVPTYSDDGEDMLESIIPFSDVSLCGSLFWHSYIQNNPMKWPGKHCCGRRKSYLNSTAMLLFSQWWYLKQMTWCGHGKISQCVARLLNIYLSYYSPNRDDVFVYGNYSAFPSMLWYIQCRYVSLNVFLVAIMACVLTCPYVCNDDVCGREMWRDNKHRQWQRNDYSLCYVVSILHFNYM